jgi:hypothetical protein
MYSPTVSSPWRSLRAEETLGEGGDDADLDEQVFKKQGATVQ